MKRNLWKKWRGKSKILERKTEIPTDIDRIQEKIRRIEEKIEQYRKRKEEQQKKRDRKKKEWQDKHRMIIEDSWSMMRWLVQYIDENKYEWERRGVRREKSEDLERWTNMDEEEMITILKKTEDQQRLTEETKKERAARRKSYWTS